MLIENSEKEKNMVFCTFIKYKAIFEKEYDEINISFPDLPGCLSCAFNEKDAFKMAKEALRLYLDGEKYDELPIVNNYQNIKLSNKQKIYLISVEMEIVDGYCIDKYIIREK